MKTMKVIGFNIQLTNSTWEVYFPWDYRGIAKRYLESIYSGQVTSEIIIKDGLKNEVDDALSNLKKMKEHYKIV